MQKSVFAFLRNANCISRNASTISQKCILHFQKCKHHFSEMQIAFPEMQIPFLRNANGMLDIYDTPFARTVRCVHRIANGILIMRLTCPVVRACSYGGALDFIVYTISQKWILHFQKCILHFQKWILHF